MDKVAFYKENKVYLDGLLRRDSKVLHKIYDSFFPGILLYVKERGGSAEDAEDVFQDGMVVVYRQIKAGKLKLTSSFYTYLFAVCKRIWLKSQSKTYKSKTQLQAVSVNMETEAEIESIIERTEKNQFFREKFKLLGQDCQKVLDLFFAGTRMKEIARIMKYGSEGYAKKRKLNCRKKLFDLIREDPRFEEFKN